jgi:hypothetical protein
MIRERFFRTQAERTRPFNWVTLQLAEDSEISDDKASVDGSRKPRFSQDGAPITSQIAIMEETQPSPKAKWRIRIWIVLSGLILLVILAGIRPGYSSGRLGKSGCQAVSAAQMRQFAPSDRVFLCVLCRSGSAWATCGRGLRKRKPSCRNSRWHCRTFRSTPNSRRRNADRVGPSHICVGRSNRVGLSRNAISTLRSCSSLKRAGRPDRSPSESPDNPCASKRCTQFTTLRAESLNKPATCGQLMPVQRAARHEVGDRIVTCRCGGSHPVAYF